VVEDAADDAALGDEGDHPHHASLAGTDEGIELVHPSSRRQSSGRGGGVVRSPGLGSPGPLRSEPSTPALGCPNAAPEHVNGSIRPPFLHRERRLVPEARALSHYSGDAF
jgi:hypothetical protein